MRIYNLFKMNLLYGRTCYYNLGAVVKALVIVVTLLCIISFMYNVSYTDQPVVKNTMADVIEFKNCASANFNSNVSDEVDVDTPCREKQAVVFLKVHKCGSTTIMNIMLRFGEARQLYFALPKGYNENYLGNPTRTRIDLHNLVDSAPSTHCYDMLFNHVVYNRRDFQRIMPLNSVYLAIVRHPFSRLISAIEYLKPEPNSYISKIPGPDNVKSFLENPERYETKDQAASHTKNAMSYDFGLSPDHYSNESYIKSFVIEKLSEFDLIMVLEHFGESLVLMRRLLCWETKDIVHIQSNSNQNKSSYSYDAAQKEVYRKFANADHVLYEMVLAKFNQLLARQTRDFFSEVEHMKDVNMQVEEFCRVNNMMELHIPTSSWSPAFLVNSHDCVIMKEHEITLLNYSRKRITEQLKKIK